MVLDDAEVCELVQPVLDETLDKLDKLDKLDNLSGDDPRKYGFYESRDLGGAYKNVLNVFDINRIANHENEKYSERPV